MKSIFGCFYQRVGPGNSFKKRRSLIAKEVRINREIRAREVRVIGAEGNQVGVLPIMEALKMAQDEMLDLVEISPTAAPPVCKIMDFGKYKYELKKKQQEARKNQKIIIIKEVKFRPKIDEHDYQFKVKNIKGFLEDQNKVKITIMFKGREIQYTDSGYALLFRIKEELKEIAEIESEGRLEGKNIIMILNPK